MREEKSHLNTLTDLYVVKNKSIREIGEALGVSDKTVFQRLGRLGIRTSPHLKLSYLNKRRDVRIPKRFTADLAEFFGIMLGDGKLSHFQVAVTLGDKEVEYAKFIVKLVGRLFGIFPKVAVRKGGYRIIYLGSVDLTEWLIKQGLVFNKVKEQVDVPGWIFTKQIFMKRFLRGFFDTDGSVYKTRFGCQMSFTNRSEPLLYSLHHILNKLQYNPSAISCHKIYITRRKEVFRFFGEIKPQNNRHLVRFGLFAEAQVVS